MNMPGAHHLDHILGHVVGAHRDIGAGVRHFTDARAEPASRRNSRVEGDIDTGIAEQVLLGRGSCSGNARRSAGRLGIRFAARYFRR